MAQREAERPSVAARARLIPCRSQDRRWSPPDPRDVGRRWSGTPDPSRRLGIRVALERRPAPERRRCRGHKRCAAGRTRHARSPTGWRRRMLGTSRRIDGKHIFDARTGRPTNKIATRTACPPAPRARRRPARSVALGGDPWRRRRFGKSTRPVDRRSRRLVGWRHCSAPDHLGNNSRTYRDFRQGRGRLSRRLDSLASA